eukprot:SAG11_NODE_20887_length_436_cov_0.925816_2_plen_60_part_01
MRGRQACAWLQGRRHQRAVLQAKADETVRTTIFSGRPMRVAKSPYVMECGCSHCACARAN